MSNPDKTEENKKKSEPPLGELEIGGALYQTRLTSKFVNRKSWERPDEKKLFAVIPGTIQNLMVKEGDMVTVGTPLMILEAMKMRNEVRAPVEGVVEKIHVRVGEQVPKASLLLEIRD